MANLSHINWLLEGVRKWNKRRKKVAFVPDLSGIRFFDYLPPDYRQSPKASRFFEKINLSEANLTSSDLSGLNFEGANFSKADLSRADLSLSNFRRADFTDSLLVEVNAENAVFSSATLVNVDFTSANLDLADVSNALMIGGNIQDSTLGTIAVSTMRSYQSIAAFRAETRLSASLLPPPDAASAGNADPRTAKNVYDVMFGTNRDAVIERLQTVDYGGKLTQVMKYGVCEVTIPEGRKIGTLGSSLWRRILNRKNDAVSIVDTITLDEELFWEHLRQTSARMKVKERPTIFVHGFNTSFRDAVLRSAQIGLDLGIGQGIGLFSWPSAASKRAYAQDETSAFASKYALADFIEGFVNNSDQTSINIIAHSMGCRCLLDAFEVLSNGRKSVIKKVNQVILAAADVDATVMPNLAKHVIPYCKRTTSYVSKYDNALKVSGWLHGFPRVGFRPPTFVFSGLDTIVVSDKKLLDFSHGYVANSRNVLKDVFDLLKHNSNPQDRFAIESVTESSGSFWRIKR